MERVNVCRLLSIALLSLVTLARGADEELARPIPIYHKSLIMGERALLQCSTDKDRIQGMVVTHWRVPDISQSTKRLIDINAGSRWNFIEVPEQGRWLEIEKVLLEHEGDFECHVRTLDDKITFYKTTVIVKGVPTIERYRLNIIIGVVAALVAFLICMVIWVLYNFRWEARHGRSDTKPIVVSDPEVEAQAANSARASTYPPTIEYTEPEKARMAYTNNAATVEIENPSYDGNSKTFLDTKM